MTTNQVFPNRKPAFVVVSRVEWSHQRLIAGPFCVLLPNELGEPCAPGLTTIPALLVGGLTHVAGRLTRAAYQPSFAYALPFHLPPVRAPQPPHTNDSIHSRACAHRVPHLQHASWAGGRRWRWWYWAVGSTNMSRARSTATRRPFPTYVAVLNWGLAALGVC